MSKRKRPEERVKPPDPTTEKKGEVVVSLPQRRIVISGEISHTTAFHCGRALKQLTKNKNKKPIVVFVTGPGGDFFASLRIHHMISSCNKSRAPVSTVGFGGFVRSGALIVLQSGGCRFVAAKTVLRFHRAQRTFPEGEVFNSKRFIEEKDLLDIIDGTQAFIFSYRGRPASKIYPLFLQEAELSPQKALSFCLVDGVLKGKEISKLQRQVNSERKKIRKDVALF